jgi:hypothetical protein
MILLNRDRFLKPLLVLFAVVYINEKMLSGCCSVVVQDSSTCLCFISEVHRDHFNEQMQVSPALFLFAVHIHKEQLFCLLLMTARPLTDRSIFEVHL